MIVKIVIIFMMLAILFSLFRALYFLATSDKDSKKTVTNLSWRIGLSIGLFVLIIAAMMMGWIEPHGLPIVEPE